MREKYCGSQSGFFYISSGFARSEKDLRRLHGQNRSIRYSDPVRLEIFEMLTDGKLCACKILERFSVTQPTLSYHMKHLVDSGLVIAEKKWKWNYYSVNTQTLSCIADYFGYNLNGSKREE